MAFTYPRSRHIRRHGPHGYRDYRSYKPWLRDEFAFRCVYCLWRSGGVLMVTRCSASIISCRGRPTLNASVTTTIWRMRAAR